MACTRVWSRMALWRGQLTDPEAARSATVYIREVNWDHPDGPRIVARADTKVIRFRVTLPDEILTLPVYRWWTGARNNACMRFLGRFYQTTSPLYRSTASPTIFHSFCLEQSLGGEPSRPPRPSPSHGHAVPKLLPCSHTMCMIYLVVPPGGLVAHFSRCPERHQPRCCERSQKPLLSLPTNRYIIVEAVLHDIRKLGSSVCQELCIIGDLPSSERIASAITSHRHSHHHLCSTPNIIFFTQFYPLL